MEVSIHIDMDVDVEVDVEVAVSSTVEEVELGSACKNEKWSLEVVVVVGVIVMQVGAPSVATTLPPSWQAAAI